MKERACVGNIIIIGFQGLRPSAARQAGGHWQQAFQLLGDMRRRHGRLTITTIMITQYDDANVTILKGTAVVRAYAKQHRACL